MVIIGQPSMTATTRFHSLLRPFGCSSIEPSLVVSQYLL